MVSEGLLLVMRMVYWKQCFRMGGSDCSVLYFDETSTVSGPDVVEDELSIGILISPLVTSGSPGRRGLPPAASAAAASRALAADPLGLLLCVFPASSAARRSSGFMNVRSASSETSPSPLPSRLIFLSLLTSALASSNAFSRLDALSFGSSGSWPSISLARSSRFLLSSSISALRRPMVLSLLSLASLSSLSPGLRIISSQSFCSFSKFFLLSAAMARPRLTLSSKILCSSADAALPAEIPIS
mmetsp:Transcript_15261/g.19346  ORF Transcript_15261/g.19346 Transcript_15261/m.19346 type:complete len:243 (+) Transcript_15261:1109-1837(+)